MTLNGKKEVSQERHISFIPICTPQLC